VPFVNLTSSVDLGLGPRRLDSDFSGSIDFQSSLRCYPDPNLIGRCPPPLILNG